MLTIGQYLQPTRRNLPVAEYVHPDEFRRYEADGLALGFRAVFAGPLVRSSYAAEVLFRQLPAAGGDGGTGRRGGGSDPGAHLIHGYQRPVPISVRDRREMSLDFLFFLRRQIFGSKCFRRPPAADARRYCPLADAQVVTKLVTTPFACFPGMKRPKSGTKRGTTPVDSRINPL